MFIEKLMLPRENLRDIVQRGVAVYYEVYLIKVVEHEATGIVLVSIF